MKDQETICCLTTWISVDDRLPDEGEDVLCFVPINNAISELHIFICLRDRYVEDNGELSSYWCWFYQYDGGCSEVSQTITHWMPIPDAPDVKKSKAINEL